MPVLLCKEFRIFMGKMCLSTIKIYLISVFQKLLKSLCELYTLQQEYNQRSVEYNRRVAYVKECVYENIMQVKDLMSETGDLIFFQEFQRKHPHVKGTNFRLYEGINTCLQTI